VCVRAAACVHHASRANGSVRGGRARVAGCEYTGVRTPELCVAPQAALDRIFCPPKQKHPPISKTDTKKINSLFVEINKGFCVGINRRSLSAPCPCFFFTSLIIGARERRAHKDEGLSEPQLGGRARPKQTKNDQSAKRGSAVGSSQPSAPSSGAWLRRLRRLVVGTRSYCGNVAG
jgi:hypothetical protein